MRSYFTYYSNKTLSVSSTLLPATLAYKQRVEAGGGSVHNINYVNECYQFIADVGITGSNNGCWINAHFGNKINGSNQVEKAYCLFGNDMVPVTQNTSRVLLTSVINNQKSYSFERGALKVESASYSVSSGKVTVGMVSVVTAFETIIFAEYSDNFNSNSGWGTFMEDSSGRLTAGIKPLPDAYSISQVTEINTPNIVTNRVTTFDLSRSSNESSQLVNGYTSTVFGNYNIDNPNDYVLSAQPLYLGGRGGTNFLTNKAHVNGLSVLPVTLSDAVRSRYSTLLSKPYEASFYADM
ncbi:hypothetical protein [Hymenobacter sublimis]|uniref:Uncharacterized protein n=1 Tax=Hymenobacter sublimis TaxID=2933777 RepID=A0ABY4JD80_9BACT|nr:hypothetical protein [Hymenobacter sublimis]UPL50535.1 hypothetical protein MWH26_06410 [Hymenobacter sublimis]